ncbi:IS21 family transposase [Pseudomonas aeruginosa]|jgi:transposase|nr:IS21 family transposase [Pseudomonas aeruginosa]
MLLKEQWMQIHVLKSQGLSLREIARQLGVSRNTVGRYLSAEDVPRYKARQARPTKLDPFHDYVCERVQAAMPDRIAGPALLRELRAQGYTGELRSLQALMQSLSASVVPDPVVRFETAPGQQMQCDFVVFRRGTNPLYAFTATLGFSRWRWVRFTSNERADTLISCHHALFETLGGVPREILYDNAKTIVDTRDAYAQGHHRWHPGMLDLAKRYGFLPRLCRPYRAQTKGKVERFHRYLRGNFYVPLSSWLKQSGLVLDVDTANAEVGKWLRDVANKRVHPVTNAAPVTLFEQRERTALRPLPSFASSPPLAHLLPSVIDYSVPLQHPLTVYQQLLSEVRA